MSFLYFVYIPHFKKLTNGSSLLMERSLLMENPKPEDNLGKEGKKEYHSVKKEKESFVKVTCTRRALSWRPDFDHFAPAVASNTR